MHKMARLACVSHPVMRNEKRTVTVSAATIVVAGATRYPLAS